MLPDELAGFCPRVGGQLLLGRRGCRAADGRSRQSFRVSHLRIILKPRFEWLERFTGFERFEGFERFDGF